MHDAKDNVEPHVLAVIEEVQHAYNVHDVRRREEQRQRQHLSLCLLLHAEVLCSQQGGRANEEGRAEVVGALRPVDIAAVEHQRPEPGLLRVRVRVGVRVRVRLRVRVRVTVRVRVRVS